MKEVKNKVNLKFSLLGFVLLIPVFLFLTGCDYPKSIGKEYQPIDTSQPPLQIPYSSYSYIIKKIKNDKFTLDLIAKYTASVIVARKKFYHNELMPVDLIFIWGKVAEPENYKYITFGQGKDFYLLPFLGSPARFGSYNLKTGSPLDYTYVATHFSHNHIIPATKNIYKTIKYIKDMQKVFFDGYLVNIKLPPGYSEDEIKTSLTRNDYGCEIFYVTKIKIENDVYE